MLDIPPKAAPSGSLSISLVPESFHNPSDAQPKKPTRWRFLIGGVLGMTGLAVVLLGASSIIYRLTHLTVDNGLVNGRQVRLQAPVNGKVKDFFARPGVAVRAGEVLARLVPSDQQGQTLLQLQGDVAAKSAQLASARELLQLLNRQLQGLTGQDKMLQTVNVKLAADDVSKNRAGVDAAISAETAARLNYERHRRLLADGAVSRQLVEQLRAEWQTAQAGVVQAEASLRSTHTSMNAVTGGLPLDQGASLQEQRLSLARAVEAQKSVVVALEAQLDTGRKQLNQAHVFLSDRQDVEVRAPFAGVIYTTQYDAGEQVNRPSELLTVLNCNDLWIETLVSAEQANRIDDRQPVRVQLVGEPNTLTGQVELVKAISRAELAKEQTESLLPTADSSLAGQPIARVVVRIPSLTQQSTAQRMCGIGQSARLTFGMKLFK